MANLDRRVTLVFDPLFGTKAVEAATRGPLWLLDSPQNKATAKALWVKYEKKVGHITLFTPMGDTLEEACELVISDIFEHHPRLHELTVIGISITDKIRSALGAGTFRENEYGLVFRRSRSIDEN